MLIIAYSLDIYCLLYSPKSLTYGKIQFLLTNSLTQMWKPVFKEGRREYFLYASYVPSTFIYIPIHFIYKPTYSFSSFSPYYSLTLSITPSFIKLKKQPL